MPYLYSSAIFLFAFPFAVAVAVVRVVVIVVVTGVPFCRCRRRFGHPICFIAFAGKIKLLLRFNDVTP